MVNCDYAKDVWFLVPKEMKPNICWEALTLQKVFLRCGGWIRKCYTLNIFLIYGLTGYGGRAIENIYTL